jgi:filamentous hemagglutinin
MFSLRSAIVTLVVFTQVWTPVLAQTLPISVDKNVPGQRPVVGVSGNGVPIVNIAPPSAGGVSNNRYTQFNVGPSGVVLNNSGSGSQSQLAGAIGGNPMLGNSRATTILNQVTGNNPSQLRGFMEVAGNRANVIVANPSGITCDGCGFLNANRGTLTTGLPILGPDGSVQGFDVTRGRLSVEGKGLYGDNLDQVDLIARSLELNASVWANRLNLVAGPATVGYSDSSVQAKAGADAAPTVSIDMAALGGMYANSIRLVGTEAGVGVNIGGNLAAMTGDLQVTASGDVRILPAGKVQAAGNLQMDSARAMTVDGAVAAGGDVRLNAAGDVVANNSISAVGTMAVNAGGNLTQGVVGHMQANSSVAATAGGALAFSGTTASQGAIVLQSHGAMAVDGLVSAGRDLSLNAGGNLTQGGNGRLETNGALAALSASAMALSGTAVAQGAVALQSSGGLSLGGQVSAGQNISLNTAGTLAQVAGSNIQTNGGLAATAGGALALAGSSAALGDVALQSLAGMSINGQVASGRNATLNTTGDLTFGAAAKVQSDGNLRADATGNVAIAGLVGTTGAAGATGAGNALTVHAGQDLSIGGAVSANTPLTLAAGRNLRIDGTALATAGDLAITSGQDTTLGTTGRAQASGSLSAQAGGNLSTSGILASNKAVHVNATGDARVDGTVAALGADLSLTGGNDVLVGTAGRVQAATTLTAQAGRDMALAGALSSVGNLTLTAARDATVNGIASTNAGLALNGRNVNLGTAAVVQSVTGLSVDATEQLTSAGKIVSDGTVALRAAGSLSLSGTTASVNGDLGLKSTTADVALGASAHTQAAGMLNATAARDLNVQGTTSSNGGIVFSAARDLSLGGVTAALGGDLQMDAGGAATVAADGRAQSSGALTLNTGGALNNDGLLSGGQSTTLHADGNLTNRGTVVAANDLIASTSGALNNSGRLLAGLDDQGQISVPGNLTLSAGTLTNSGLAAAGGNATLNASSLMLAGGTVSATQALNAATAGAVDAQAATLYGGTMSITGASLDNRGGDLSSSGDLALLISGVLNNQSGSIATNGILQAGGSQIINQGGKMIAQDLNVTTAGAINNAGGLLQASNTLTLSAASLANTDTPSTNPAQPLGVVGKTVTINAATIDNTRGTLAASDALTLGGSLLQNASGLVTSGGTADITVGTLANEAGNLVAGQRLSVTANALTGTGTLQSQGDLGLTLNGSLNNTGVLAAGRDATLAITGDLDNSGKISAGRNLTVGTRNLTNRASGEIVSNGITTLNVAQALDNAGLIDGHLTHIQAGSVHNTGRIYGDTLAISTGYLLNDVGAAGAGVIASRGDMDLAVGTLDNLEHALIYAAGNLSIGGALDGNWKAVGQAQAVNNLSATIQADGNASIAAGVINNKNNHFSSEVVQVSSGDKVYYRLDGSTDMLDGAVYWLCDQTTALCSKDPNWLDDDQERRLLLPSTTYPEDRFGPPFTYAKGGHGKGGYSAPVFNPYEAPYNACQGPDDNPCIHPEVFNYGLDAPIWAVFGVQPPSAPLPPVPVQGENCTINCEEMQAVYDQAHTAYVAAYVELNDKVLAFNRDFEGRLVKDFTIYEVTENVSESRTVSTDPGKIIVGGNASLSGAVTNDKSQIVAGGALNIVGPAIQNIGATGEQRIDATGQELYTYEKNDSRHYDIVPYSGTISTQPIELAVASYGGNTAPPATGISAPGATAAVSAARPPTITSVSLPGLGIVRTVTPPSSVPNNQLYTVVPAANSPYLVATDSRFTGQKPTISSDYLLALLGAAGSVSGPGSVSGSLSGLPSGSGNGPGGTQSPTQSAINSAATNGAAAANTAGTTGTNPYLQNTDTLKRLGDGFYEQKLVTDQIIAATGQRFVGDYTENATQYKDLLTAGATFAQQYGLQVGTPLSDDQMKHLTSDMVWLVDQTVTLPDGSTQTVLVPQVYLVVQDGDLKGDGTLMAGSSTSLQASGNITNTGAIGSREATVMVADNIINSSAGTIQGSYVNLNARQDLDNIAASIKGDTVALQAGRDVNLTSTTASSSATTGPTKTSSAYISGVSQIDAGSLVVTAGNNLNITAASVNADNDARLQAGNDINLLTLQTEQGESVVFGKKNNSNVQRTDQVGSNLDTGGNLTLIAGQDVNATAVNANTGGQIGIQAGRDINVLAGEATGSARDEHYQKTKGHWGATSTSHSIDTSEWTQAQSSTLTGDSVLLLAGRDVNVIGSNIGAVNDATISGDRNVTIAAAENTSNDNQYLRETRSGWGALGGLSKGHSESTDTLDGTTVFHTGSTVGSVQGDLLINAGENLQVIGSNVVARQGDIGMVGRDVTIASVTDTNHEKELHEVKQSGFSITLGGPVVDTVQTMDRLSEASQKTDNPIMQALAIGTMGLAASNMMEAVTRSPDEGGGGAGTLTINYGASTSSSTTTRDSSTVVGSTVAAGNDLTIVSTGAGKNSDITVLGSTLSAGNNAILKADGDILVQAASNTSSQHTDSKSIDGTVGAGVMVGTDGEGTWGAGFIVKGSVSANRGMEDGDNLNWANSSITAGNILALSSGGDTSLIGAAGKANQILASIGGDLLMQSVQDQSTYHSTNQSASVGGTYCYGYCSSGSVYGSYGQGKLDSDFQTVTQQTGLWAGDGGFQIDVKGNTTLIGSVIASSDKAIADGLNQLSTGTLVTKDIKNTANYDGYQVGLSGGYSWGGAQQTNSSGATQPSKGGASAMPPTWAVAFGSDKSTTESAISAGNIVIRDADGQMALTGKTVAETIASLNRDTSDTLNSLSPIFDKDKIEAGFEIVMTAQQQVATFLSYRAQDIADLLKRSTDKDVSPADQKIAADQAAELQSEWGAGGKYRIVLNAILAGTGGNISGSVGDMLQAGAINYFQSLSATQVKAIADAIGKDDNAQSGSPQTTNPEAEAARAALHAIVGCAGAAASSAACGAGAMGAAAGSVINSLLGGDPKGMSPQMQEDRRNLVTSIVEGIALATGQNVAAATSSAITETENNYLKAPQIAEYVAAEDRLKNCKDSQCREDAKAELARLRNAALVQDATAFTAKCNDNASCGAQIGDLKKDIAALEELANTATGAEADLAKVQLKAANNSYTELLLYIENRAVRDLNPDFQPASDDQLISGGYLTAPQVADLRAAVTASNENKLQRVIDGLIVMITEGMGRGGAKAELEIARAKQTLRPPASSSNAEDASGFWSTTKSKSSVENAYGHWEKHMSEFPEYSNSLEYVRGAQDFISSPPSGTLSIVRSNGDVVLYNPTSNTLAVKAADGTPKTMFRPDPAEHGYPTNLDYFNAQSR